MNFGDNLADKAISLEKQVCRSQMKDKREHLSLTEVLSASRKITKHLLASEVWQKSLAVALYVGLAKEVHTGLLIKAARDAGKHVFLPRITGPGTMIFLPASPKRTLVRNRFGIAEPEGDEEAFLPMTLKEEGSLLLLPGLAFDRRGLRLGFGGGYYDRFLCTKPRVLTIGLCFSFQLVAKLPEQPWDQRIDMLCTEDDALLPMGKPVGLHGNT